MKIVFIITRSDTIGGAQAHVRDISIQCDQLGHQVEVWTGGDGVFAERLRQAGVKVVTINGLQRQVHPLRDLSALFNILRNLRRSRPDLVACHSGKAGILGCVAARIVRVPSVFTAHGWSYNAAPPGLARDIQMLFERATSSLACQIITVSEYDYELAVHDRISSVDKLVRIWNGVHDIDSTLFARPGSRDEVNMLSVARFQEPKDFDTLIRALGQLVDRSWFLTLVGDGPDELRVRQLVAHYGVQDRVRFSGLRHDVDHVLSESDLLLLISTKEGLPLSILEAMRAGLPVVASRVGGVDEAVVDGITGYTVPSGDHVTLARKLRDLLDNQSKRILMGQEGRRRYEDLFSFKDMYERTLSVYHQVAEVELTEKDMTA